jgi:hypothetical protein
MRIVAAAIGCLSTVAASRGVDSVRVAEWGDGLDIVAAFDAGEPLLITGSPVSSWPLVASARVAPDAVEEEFGRLTLVGAVRAKKSTQASRPVVVRVAKNLPDNRDVLFETESHLFEVVDIPGSEFVALARGGRIGEMREEGRGGGGEASLMPAADGGGAALYQYWRSTTMLTDDSPDAEALWDFVLQRQAVAEEGGGEGNNAQQGGRSSGRERRRREGDAAGGRGGNASFDLQWLFYHLQYGPFDGEPSVSLEALQVLMHSLLSCCGVRSCWSTVVVLALVAVGCGGGVSSVSRGECFLARWMWVVLGGPTAVVQTLSACLPLTLSRCLSVCRFVCPCRRLCVSLPLSFSPALSLLFLSLSRFRSRSLMVWCRCRLLVTACGVGGKRARMMPAPR